MPTLIIKNPAYDTPDSYTDEMNPDLNFGLAEWIYFRGLLPGSMQIGFHKFPLTGIPPNAFIDSATLRIYLEGWAADSEGYLRRNLADWDELTITWNTQPAEGLLITPFTFTGPDWKEFIVTSIVRQWYAGTQPNYGFRFVPKDIDEPPVWWSSQNNAFDDRRPELVIVYHIIRSAQGEPSSLIGKKLIKPPGVWGTGFTYYLAHRALLLSAGFSVFPDIPPVFPEPSAPELTDLWCYQGDPKIYLTWNAPAFVQAGARIRIWGRSISHLCQRQVVANALVTDGELSFEFWRARGSLLIPAQTPGQYLFQADVLNPDGGRSPASNIWLIKIV